MTEELTRWDAAEHLHPLEDARLYVQACAKDDPGDGRLIRAALTELALAGNMASLAREPGLSREGLYKALAPDGKPTFTTVMRITRALGLQLRTAWRQRARADELYGARKPDTSSGKSMGRGRLLCQKREGPSEERPSFRTDRSRLS